MTSDSSLRAQRSNPEMYPRKDFGLLRCARKDGGDSLRTSRYRIHHLILRPPPNLARDHLLDELGCLHHLGLANIQRRDAKPHNVRRAEIADHAAGDEGLHRSVAPVESERDLRAAALMRARRNKLQG